MSRDETDPLHSQRSLREQLKGRSRTRRHGLERLAAPGAAPRALRNDWLPPLEISYIPINELRSPARRLRVHDPAHVRGVAASISALGFISPLLVGKDNEILNGEVQREAGDLLGMDCLPCVRIGHLNDAEQRLARLAVNRLGEKGQWNLDELKIEFEELILLDAPIEFSGFSLDEIDHITIGEELNVTEQGPLAPEVDLPAVARVGDTFALGPHRVVCGDAVDPLTYEMLMPDDLPVRIVLTDEPYNVPIAGHVTGGAHREFQMASGEMTEEQFLAFNVDWIGAVTPYLCKGGVFGTFIDWRHLGTVSAAALQIGLTPLNLVVWSKTNAGMGSLYRSQHELLPLSIKGGAPFVNNVGLGRNGRWRSNVWVYPGASSLGSDARRGLVDHPTVKPVAMLEDALLDLTNRGDIVMDPFLGSGSTLIAAERTGRICRGAEIDPLYVDVIVRRYEAATGSNAVLEETRGDVPGTRRATFDGRRDRAWSYGTRLQC